MLRKHQSDMLRVINDIQAGSSIKNIIVKATPGSGKSTIPIIAGDLIRSGHADALCWICPRMSLQDQAERNFIDPFFRKMFRHSLTIRQSTNENNPCRGLNGFVSTYQALGVDKEQTVYRDFQRKRYVLILDEYHHAEADDGSWTKALLPLYEAAAYRVLMTGTLSRGDRKKIAFTPYVRTFDGFVASLEGDRETAIIEYSRSDALAEKAILPLSFIFNEGTARWEKNAKPVESLLSTAEGANARYALYTALNTEYATELLDSAVAHWINHRRKINHAKLLVVAAGIKNAKTYADYLKRMGFNARIATSEDGPAAIKAIKAYKENRVDILVSVNICYEGLDVPAISHIACLTSIRTAEWIDQMAARAVRIDPFGGTYENQAAYVFAPSDKMFVEIKNRIESEQQAAARERQAAEEKERGDGDGFSLQAAPGGIVPLSSKLTGRREVLLSGKGQFAQIGKLNEIPERTSSEIEADLREQIDSHIRAYSFQNRFNPKRINAEVSQYFNKKRQEMTIKELENCLLWVKSTYPLTRIRGTGIQRVPAKAAAYPCEWR